ncbi:MAG: hypothetical protein IPP19_05730 [Verrucomicrobia bacterium]|nr:hypothetical protein [Verrucomicrobiota bacterium]
MSGLLVAASRTLHRRNSNLQAAEEVTSPIPSSSRVSADAWARSLAVKPCSSRAWPGNLGLPRTRDGALPYRIYNREQLERSGVVNLNAFLQRNYSTATPPRDRPSRVAYSMPSGDR